MRASSDVLQYWIARLGLGILGASSRPLLKSFHGHAIVACNTTDVRGVFLQSET